MTTLRSKKTTLVNLDKSFGFLRPNTKEEDNLLYLHLPLRSHRITIETEHTTATATATGETPLVAGISEYSDPHYLLNPRNQRYFRSLIENDLFVKYNQVEKILQTQLLRSRLDQWSAKTIYQRKQIHSIRRLMPEVLQMHLPDTWFYRKGCQLLGVTLWYYYQRQCKKAFFHWKYHTNCERNLIAKLFSRWSWKITAWKYNKLKAQQFIKLTRHLVKRVQHAHLIYYFKCWLDYDYKAQMFCKMKLLFRCWKTVVIGLKAGRKRAVKYAFQSLRYRARIQHHRMEKIQLIQKYYQQRRCWTEWRKQLVKKRVMIRIFMINERGKLWYAWQLWKRYLLSVTTSGAPLTPMLSQSMRYSSQTPLSPPTRIHEDMKMSTKAVYQSGDQLVYRRVQTVRQSRCLSQSRYPLPHQQSLSSRGPSLLGSLRERIESRLNVVKDMDRSFTEHEALTKPLWMQPEFNDHHNNKRQQQLDVSSSTLQSHSHSHAHAHVHHDSHIHRPKTTSTKGNSGNVNYGGVLGGAGGPRTATTTNKKTPSSAVKAPKTPASTQSARKRAPWSVA